MNKALASVAIFAAFMVPTALAAEPPLPLPAPTQALQAPQKPVARQTTIDATDYSKEAVVAFASSTAVKYGLNPEHFINVIEHESHFSNDHGRPSPTGDYGYCQINRASHTDLSMTFILDPYSCIPWMAQQWAGGNAHWWTFWRILYGT